MQRLFSLIALSFFSLLFCFTAAHSFQPQSSSPGKSSVEPPLQQVQHRSLPGSSSCEKFPLRSSRIEYRSTGRREEKKSTPPPAKPPAKKEAASERCRTKTPPEDRDNQNQIHFLLIGRWWEEESAQVLITVTLAPRRYALLTALSPAAEVKVGARSRPAGDLLNRGQDREQLYAALTALTGEKPQFYIDLNLHGFIQMVDLLQEAGADKKAGKAKKPKTDLDGDAILQLLDDPETPTAVKEKTLLRLLLAACKIQFTKAGVELLWTGYHNMKTDLTFKEILELRKVTQEISPRELILTEIAP